MDVCQNITHTWTVTQEKPSINDLTPCCSLRNQIQPTVNDLHMRPQSPTAEAVVGKSNNSQNRGVEKPKVIVNLSKITSDNSNAYTNNDNHHERTRSQKEEPKRPRTGYVYESDFVLFTCADAKT